MVLADSGRITRVPHYLGTQSGDTLRFRLRDCHPLWSDFPDGSPIEAFLPGHPFFFNDPATTEIYTLSLHDAPPIRSNISRRTRRFPPFPQRTSPGRPSWCAS